MCWNGKETGFIAKKWRMFLNDLSTVSIKDRELFWWPSITSLVFYLIIVIFGIFLKIKIDAQSFDLETYIIESLLSLYSTVSTFCITTAVQCIVHAHESSAKDFRIKPFMILLIFEIIYTFVYFSCLLGNSVFGGVLLLVFSAIVIWQTICSFVIVHKNLDVAPNPQHFSSLSGNT